MRPADEERPALGGAVDAVRLARHRAVAGDGDERDVAIHVAAAATRTIRRRTSPRRTATASTFAPNVTTRSIVSSSTSVPLVTVNRVIRIPESPRLRRRLKWGRDRRQPGRGRDPDRGPGPEQGPLERQRGRDRAGPPSSRSTPTRSSRRPTGTRSTRSSTVSSRPRWSAVTRARLGRSQGRRCEARRA